MDNLIDAVARITAELDLILAADSVHADALTEAVQKMHPYDRSKLPELLPEVHASFLRDARAVEIEDRYMTLAIIGALQAQLAKERMKPRSGLVGRLQTAIKIENAKLIGLVSAAAM